MNNIKRLKELADLCSGSQQDAKRLFNICLEVDITDERFKRLERLFDGAIAITSVKEARFALAHEWILLDLYGKPSETQMRKITFHLDNMRRMTSNMGKDSTEKERRVYRIKYSQEMESIKSIHAGYYHTIKNQAD